MRVQFLHRHVLNIVVILEEATPPLPRCGLYNMMVPRRDLNNRYPATAQCVRGVERKRPRLAEAETREISKQAL